VNRLVSRPLVANALIVVGASLVLVSATSVARGAIARDNARSLWAQMEASRAATGARLSLAGSNWAVVSGAPVARLEIPRLELDEIVVEGVDESALRAGPGHMTGSALPGDSGNAVISAHRDRHFKSLGKVVVGDTIHTDGARGQFTWVVTRVRVVDADAPVLRSSATPLLTLTTCWPVRYLGPAPDRLIVEARLGTRD
jgi:LPXTG-site transpeptidase (sortase) family protein